MDAAVVRGVRLGFVVVEPEPDRTALVDQRRPGRVAGAGADLLGQGAVVEAGQAVALPFVGLAGHELAAGAFTQVGLQRLEVARFGNDPSSSRRARAR